MRMVLLALLVIGLPALFGAGIAMRSRGKRGGTAARGGIVSGWLAHRRALRLRQVDHENGMHRERFRSMLRMREQAERERRAEQRARSRRAGTVRGEAWTEPGGADRPGPARNSHRPSFIRLRPESPAPPEPQAGDRPGRTDGAPQARTGRLRGMWPGHRGTYRPSDVPEHDGWIPPPDNDPPTPAPGGVRRPARPGTDGTPGSADTPPPAVPGTPTDRPPPTVPDIPRPPARGEAVPPVPGQPHVPVLEGDIVTVPDTAAMAVPGVEQIIEGLRVLRAAALAGNIQSKRAAVLGLGEAARQAAMTSLTLSRAMAEPGMHYGPEVTERLAMMGAHFSAANLASGDVDGQLVSLLATTLAEAVATGRYVPHHAELSETGAH